MKQGTHSNAWTSAIVVISLVFAALAPSNAALADDVRWVRHEIPAELLRRVADGSAEASYGIAGFPDGGAAIQVSIRISDPNDGPFPTNALDGTFLTFLDRDGDVTDRIVVRGLEARDAYLKLGLANRHVVMQQTRRGSVFLAEIDSRGAPVWQSFLSAHTNFEWSPPPISLPNGGFALLEGNEYGNTLYRLGADGKIVWQVDIPLPGFSEEYEWSSPVVAAADDGAIVTICDFFNIVASRRESWMFRFDDRGDEIWRRRLPGLAEDAVALPDGTIAVFGLPHSFPDIGAPPYPRHDSLPLMRMDMNDGSVIRIYRTHLPAPWGVLNCDRCGLIPMALPDSGMMLMAYRPVSAQPYKDVTALIRLDRDHQVMSLLVASDPPPSDGQFLRIFNMALLGSRLLVAGTRRDPATGTEIPGFYTIPIADLEDSMPYRKTDRR